MTAPVPDELAPSVVGGKVTTDGNARSFDSDAVPLDFGDNVHWLGVSRLLVGIGCGTAALT